MLKQVSNKDFLLGDFDGDKIKNIDDRLPFKKSSQRVEETKLSTPIEKAYKINKQKRKATKLIIEDFRKTVNQKKRFHSRTTLERTTPYRTKKPISTINKAFDKGIGEVKDYIGTSYLGNNYNDLREMEKHIKTKFLITRRNDYYKKPRRDGYKAIHLNAVHKGTGEVFEIQLKTKRIKRISEINHILYKDKKQNPPKFKELVALSEKADNGNKKAQKFVDSLSRKEVLNYIKK